jgi:hypothetical protein
MARARPCSVVAAQRLHRRGWRGRADDGLDPVILMAGVGGGSLIAARVKRSYGWHLTSIVAGAVMVFWIIGDEALIRGCHFLQVIYLETGALVVWCTSARDRSSEPACEELTGVWSTSTVLSKRPVPGNSRDPNSALRLTGHWMTPQTDRGARNPSSSD